MKKLISAICALSMLTMSAPVYAADTTKNIYGDADCDGTVDMFDAVAINNYLNGNTKSITEQGKKNADAYYPGSGITIEDAEAVIAYVNAETLLPVKAKKYGDTDCDGAIDVLDTVTASNYVKGVIDELAIQAKANADVYQPGTGITIEDVRAINGYVDGRVTFPYGDGTKVTVSGDVNCDGVVDINDAVDLVQALNNNKELSKQAWVNADVFEQGSGLTVEDAKAIECYVNGKIKSLPTDKLPNEDYDIGDDVWHKGNSYTSAVDYYIDTDTYKNSDYSIVIDNTDFNDAAIEKKIKVDPNSRYRISAMVKSENYKAKEDNKATRTGASVGVISGSGYPNHSFTVNDEQNNEWTKVEYTFYTGENEYEKTVFLRNGRCDGCCMGKAYFSDVRIEKIEGDETNKWDILAIVLKNVDAEYNSNGDRITDSLTAEDIDLIEYRLNKLKNTIPTISDNKMDVNSIDIKYVDKTIKNSLGYYNAGDCIGATVNLDTDEMREIIDSYTKNKEYDEIIIFDPLRDRGVGVGLAEDSQRNRTYRGYATICQIPCCDKNHEEEKKKFDTELGYLHEILHGIEYRSYEINPQKSEGLHGNINYDKYKDPDQNNSWETWYINYMRATLPDGKGIDPNAYTVYKNKKYTLISDDMTVNESQIMGNEEETTTTTTKKASTTTTTTSTTTSTTTKKSETSSAKVNTTTPKVTGENEVIWGDANCDKDVDLADAVLIMQSLSNPNKYGLSGTDKGHLTEKGSSNADVAGNGDGVTNLDALTIQKYKLSIIKSLPETDK